MGGVEVRCLIDTGSQVSTITESCFRRYIARDDLELDSCGWLKLTAANGLSIPYVGYVKLDVTCMGRTIPRRGILIVCNSPDAEQQAHKEKCPGVLGMNVLGEFNMALSHNDRSATLGNCSSEGMVASVNDANRRDRKGFVRVVDSQSVPIPSESCTTLRVSGCSQHADGTWVVVEPIIGTLPADVSVCSTVARVCRGGVPVQVVNTGREDVWLQPRTRIGVYQTVVHVRDEDNVCFQRVSVNEEVVTQQSSRPAPVVGSHEGIGSGMKIGPHCTTAQVERLQEVISRNAQAFARDEDDLGYTDLARHSIRTVTDVPVRQPFRRIPPTQYQEVKEHISGLLK